MQPLQWTTDTPEEPGWYWCDEPGATGQPEIIELDAREIDILNQDRWKPKEGTRWAGPIPLPE